MFLLRIFLIIIAIIGIYLQYRIEHIIKGTKKKQRYGKIILIVTVLSLIGSNVSQYFDSRQFSKDISDMKKSNDTLRVKLEQRGLELNKVGDELKNIQAKNDSLLVANDVLKKLIPVTSVDIKQGFAQNEEYLKNIETKKLVRKRLLTKEQKTLMISILSTQKGKSLPIECSEGDKESGQFAEQIMQVFKAAGWKTWLNRIIGGYSNDTKMAELNILIKDITIQ